MGLFSRSEGLPNSPDKWRSGLEAALRVSEIASSASALPDAVKAMLAIAIELLEAEQGSMMLTDEDGHTLVLVASSGLPTDVPLGFRLPVGESMAGRVLATGQPLLLGQVDRDAFVNFVPKKRPISSSVVVPMRVGGRAVGVLNLAIAHRSTSFTEEDVRVAQMFADQAAGLINRAKLHEQAEHRSADLLALLESSRGLAGALDVESLLQGVLDGGTRLATAKDGFVCLFDPETGAISRGVFRGLDKATIRKLIDEPDVRGAIENVDVALVDHTEVGSFIALGLLTTQGTKGLLLVVADRSITMDRQDLFRAFGQQCATSLGAAELHAQIERKETELTSIIQTVPNPIVMVDARGRIVALNPAAEQVFGISAMFSTGSSVDGVLGHTEVEEMLTGDGEIHGEVLVGNPPRTYRVRVTDVRVPGAPIGRVLTMDDVTAERERVQTQRDFVAMIGHELRTPLTIIKGFALTLLRRIESASPEDTRESLTTIDAKARQLERLIEDLLYVSKIEAREASLRIEKVDITTLCNSVATDVIEEHPGREIQLDVPGDLVWSCDETKVGLVLRHLVENGLKYSSSPEVVVVRAFEENDEIRVDVIDRGMGILSTDIPYVFERFRQIDNTATRQHGGTGVGLYLCAQLVRAHQSKIWVDSSWGKGSTFSFSLPRSSGGDHIVKIHAKKDLRSA